MYFYNSLCDIPLIQEEMKKLHNRTAKHIKLFAELDISDDKKKKVIDRKNEEYKEEIKELRATLKDLIQKRNQLNAKLIKIVRKYDYDNWSGTNIWIFKKGCAEEDIEEFLVKCYCVDMEGYSINSMYDCTGRKFTHDVKIEERKNTIVASQWWGLDV